MDKLASVLSVLPLFRGIDPSEIKTVLAPCTVRIKTVSPRETVFMQGDQYNELFILISGSCIGSMIDISGKEIIVEHFTAPVPIAAGILFSEHAVLPVSIRAVQNSELLILTKSDVLRLCSLHQRFLLNFLGLVSDKVAFLSNRLSFMSFKSIRKKTAQYILSLPSTEGRAVLPLTIEELATYFGVARPSLSRVFQQLEAEHIIKKTGREIYIFDSSKLLDTD